MTLKPGARRGPLLPYEQARRAASWLTDVREDAELSRAEFARRLSFSPASVYLRESGGSRMTLAEVTAIAGVLAVPVPDLTVEGRREQFWALRSSMTAAEASAVLGISPGTGARYDKARPRKEGS